MDSRLERLKNSLLNSWFPHDISIFELEDISDIDELMVHLFSDAIGRFRTAFPGMRGRVYIDYDSNNPLYLKDIDPNILRLLGVTPTNYPLDTYGFTALQSLAGRDELSLQNSNSYFLSDSAALDLYSHITVDEWSGRMSKPLEMYDEDKGDEFVLVDWTSFIVFMLVERTVDINHVPTNLYQPLEAFITYNLASYVSNALGRYPLSLALKDIADDTASATPGLDADNLTSVTINGKLSLTLDSSSNNYDDFSSLFSGGSAGKYLDQLQDIYLRYKRIFEILKYERTGGMSVV